MRRDRDTPLVTTGPGAGESTNREGTQRSVRVVRASYLFIMHVIPLVSNSIEVNKGNGFYFYLVICHCME